MMTVKTKEQTINWLKAALGRQQAWQQEVKKRWAKKQCPKVAASL